MNTLFSWSSVYSNSSHHFSKIVFCPHIYNLWTWNVCDILFRVKEILNMDSFQLVVQDRRLFYTSLPLVHPVQTSQIQLMRKKYIHLNSILKLYDKFLTEADPAAR